MGKDKSPLVINFGSKVEVLEFDPAVKQAFALRGQSNQMLVVAWDIDHAGYGFWRIKTIGIKNDEIIMKEFEPERKHAAFHGSVSIIGAGQTELYSSFSYEDNDMTDEDGNIVNKAKEIHVYPVRED